LQDPSQGNVDNLNSVRREASRHLRNEKKSYRKAKIEEVETNSKIKNIRHLCRGISDFKKGCQLRTNTGKDEKGNLVVDSHSILVRWRNHFSQLFNIHGVNDVRQTELHTAEPLVLEPSAVDFDLVIQNLKVTNHRRIDQIQAELIKAGGRAIHYDIHKRMISIWNKEELPEDLKESIIVPSYKKDDKTDCSNHRAYIFANNVQNFIQHPAVKVNSICRGNYWGLSMWISTQQVNY